MRRSTVSVCALSVFVCAAFLGMTRCSPAVDAGKNPERTMPVNVDRVGKSGEKIALAADELSDDVIPRLWPLAGGVKTGRVSLGFGSVIDPFTEKPMNHRGMDIAAVMGTSVIATGQGTVTDIGLEKDAGYYVAISHTSGFTTYYSHLMEDVRVKKGDAVTAGQVIASLGNSGRSTGPHLHYEVIFDSKNLNPLEVVGAALRMAPDTVVKEGS